MLPSLYCTASMIFSEQTNKQTCTISGGKKQSCNQAWLNEHAIHGILLVGNEVSVSCSRSRFTSKSDPSNTLESRDKPPNATQINPA